MRCGYTAPPSRPIAARTASRGYAAFAPRGAQDREFPTGAWHISRTVTAAH